MDSEEQFFKVKISPQSLLWYGVLHCAAFDNKNCCIFFQDEEEHKILFQWKNPAAV